MVQAASGQSANPLSRGRGDWLIARSMTPFQSNTALPTHDLQAPSATLFQSLDPPTKQRRDLSFVSPIHVVGAFDHGGVDARCTGGVSADGRKVFRAAD